MKVFYVNEESGTIVSLNEIEKLKPNSKVLIECNGRNVEYTLDDIYNCRDWKVYTQDDYSLTLDDIREIMSKVDKNTELYNKLQNEESKLLGIWVENITSGFEFERTIF